MPRIARWLVAIVLAAPAVGWAQASPSRAETAAAREAGEAAFRVGAQAFRANQFDVAARALEQAYQLDPRPETAFSIAQANRLQYYLDRVPWRIQRAVQLYQVYLERLPAGPRAQDAIDRLAVLEPALAELRQRGELTPYVAPVRTELVVGADVDRAAVTIDGRPVELWQPLAVAAGAHEIVVDAPGYQPARRRVVIAAGRFLPVDVSLQAKPGRIRVRAEPGSTVFVDGRRRGSAAADVEVPAGEHFISVTHRGREPWSQTARVGRDQVVALDATLRPTGQRRVARWVMVTAGTLAVGAGATSLWAYSARREARALDDDRRAQGATPETLARYNALVDDDQHRRGLALGLGIAALSSAALGAAMWWFDQEPPGAQPSLEVAPGMGVDQAGVVITGRF